MNRQQITILWIALTVFLPSAYFIVSGGLRLQGQVSENRAIRQPEGATNKQTYLITIEQGGKDLTYEVETDRYPVADEEVMRLIERGRLLSEREAKAWDEQDRVERQRRRYWEFSVAGVFVATSLTGLFMYRAKKV